LVAPLRGASAPFRPQASDLGEGPQGKGWFHREPDQNPMRPALPGSGRGKGAEPMNTYEIVTERIINLLEQGVIPWRRPWAATGLPRSLVSKKIYRGINSFLLGATKYVSPYWLTLRQANQLGGSVRKGEHGEIVVFWKTENADQMDPDEAPSEGDESARRRFILRFYRAWNVEQCALPQAVLDKLPAVETHQHDPIEAAEKIIAKMPNPPEIRYGGSQAFYSPFTDRITLPSLELFTSAEEFSATKFHEFAHASGHPTRLNRESISEAAPFGSPVYGREELLAEMCAAFLCAEAGISPAVLENQTAYIQGWLGKLQGDKRMVVIAAAQAQRAADYILNVRVDNDVVRP
jgi:antirestriction protein ArdC